MFVFDTDILDPLLARGLRHDRRVEFIRGVADRAVRRAGERCRRAVARADRASRPGDRRGAARSPTRSRSTRCSSTTITSRRRSSATEVVADRLARDGRVLRRLQGPDDLREGRDRHAGRHAVHGLHAVQARVAEGADAVPRRRRIRSTGTSSASRPCRNRSIETMPSLDDHGLREDEPRRDRHPARHVGRAPALRRVRTADADYAEARDPPAARGTSYLSVHLRFGTISIRALARAALDRARHAADDARRRDVARRADLARLLLPDPPPPTRPRRAAHRSSRASTASLGTRRDRRRPLRRVVRGAHRLPAGRRRDGADQQRPASCTTACGW